VVLEREREERREGVWGEEEGTIGKPSGSGGQGGREESGAVSREKRGGGWGRKN
jgi:hypothetical protein